MKTETTKTTKKKSENRQSISFSEAIKIEFDSLKGDKSNPEFMSELLEAYKKLSGKNCSSKPENFFPNLQGKEREEKEPHIREMFGLEPEDPLLMSECELLKKASEYSGKTIEELALEGRVLVAKNEIGRQIQYKMGKGKRGMGDEKIAQTLEFLKQTGQKLSLNRLTTLSGSNRKTVESWCERNNVIFE